jgi:hypothetical protein
VYLVRHPESALSTHSTTGIARSNAPDDRLVRLVNFLLYQAGWLACVLGAAWQYPWTGMFLALLLVAVHLWLCSQPIEQIKLLLVSAGVGLVVDSTLLWAGAYRFSAGMHTTWLPPLWMTVLWMQFATTFQYSMRWLSGRYGLSALFGLFGAPLAFYAGERLGAIEFLAPRLLHFLALGILWCGAIPLLIYLSDRLAARRLLAPTYRLL